MGAGEEKQYYIFSDMHTGSLKAISRNEGASIPCTLMVYVSVEFLALMRDGEDTLTLLM